MATFKEMLLEEEINEMEKRILTFIYLSENMEMLNESEEILEEGINDYLGKVGLKLHKGDGLFDYVKQFTKGAGKMILAAFKGDKEKIKEIAKGLDKAKVIDFLLKLDMATMHLVTGPIHLIDAVTGWDLMSNIQHATKKAEDMITIFKGAIQKIKLAAQNIFSGDKQKVIFKHVERLEKSVA